MTTANVPSLTKRATKGLFWTSSGAIARGVAQIVTLTVLARLVTPDDFGVVSAALVVIGIGTIFTQVGVGPALVQRADLTDGHLQTAIGITLALGITATVSTYYLSEYIAIFFQMQRLAEVLQIISIMFLIRAFGVVAESLLQRHGKFAALAAIEAVSYVIGYGLAGVGLALAGYGVWALVSAQLVQAAVATVLALALQKSPLLPAFNRESAVDLLTFGSGVTVGQIATQLAAQADNAIVGRLLGAGALGIYSRAYQLTMMPAALFGQVLGRVMFPLLAEVQHDRRRLSSVLERSIAVLTLTVVPMSAILCMLAPEIINILFGAGWEKAVGPLQLLLAGLLFRIGYKLCEPVVKAIGAVHMAARRQLVYAATVVLLAYIGQFWGLNGVALGVTIAAAAHFSMMLRLCLILTNTPLVSIARASLPGVMLGIVGGAFTGMAVAIARYLELPQIVVLLLAGGSLIVIATAVGASFPNRFLGEHGKWAVRLVLSARRRNFEGLGNA